jgi:hypothetical protein
VLDSIKSFFRRIFTRNLARTEVAANVLMPPVPVQCTNLDKRREVLDWRDRHMAEMETSLKGEISSLTDSVRKACSQMIKSDTSQLEEHYKKTIQPICDLWISNTGKNLIEAAIRDFPITTATSGNYHGAESVFRQAENISISTDSRTAKAAIAAGISVPLASTMATMSAPGIAGLLGATVVAWPVVAAGALIGGGLLLFGSKSLASRWEREKSEYETKLIGLVQESILGRSKDRKSLLQMLEQSIDDIASKALKETKW